MHLRPTVILRVDAHSVSGSRKHVPCRHTSAHGSGACCCVHGPRELLVLWSSRSLLLDGGICSGIEHQQDQLMYQQTVIDEAGVARTPVPQYAQEYKGKLVDLRIGNKP